MQLLRTSSTAKINKSAKLNKNQYLRHMFCTSFQNFVTLRPHNPRFFPLLRTTTYFSKFSWWRNVIIVRSQALTQTAISFLRSLSRLCTLLYSGEITRNAFPTRDIVLRTNTLYVHESSIECASRHLSGKILNLMC